MIQELCKVIQNKRVAPGHYVMKLESAHIGRHARPGQFVQILCADSNDPLLPRPFSFLETSKKSITLLYHVVGRGTTLLEAVKPKDTLKILGPLGNGFSAPQKNIRPILVGGGVGIPPLYHWVKEAVAHKVLKKSNITVLLGARDKSLLLCEKAFEALEVRVRVATDDGSKGRKGFVTELLKEELVKSGKSLIYTCGPTPMMRAVATLAQASSVPCEVSVEVPMACGFGACLGCAIKVRTIDHRPETIASMESDKKDRLLSSMVDGPSSFRYAIACCEGPVFQGDQLLWD